IANNRSSLRINTDEFHDLRGGFFALRGVTRTSFAGHIVLTGRQVEDAANAAQFLLLLGLFLCDLLRRQLRTVHRDIFIRSVFVDDAQNPWRVVYLRDQISEDTASMTNRARQVIREVERRDITFALSCQDSATAGFIRLRAE